MSTQQHLARIGAVAAMSGAVTLFVATLLHPMSADPNDPPAAFVEYAADRLWVASHLGQFLGVAALGVALAALAATRAARKCGNPRSAVNSSIISWPRLLGSNLVQQRLGLRDVTAVKLHRLSPAAQEPAATGTCQRRSPREVGHNLRAC